MPSLADPNSSQAFLVGSASYAMLEDLPGVRNNLAGLRSAFTNPEIWGLPTDNCTVVDQPADIDAVLDGLQRVAALATDTLVVYFAGHGLVDAENDDELYLALPNSDQNRTYRTALPYSWVRREIQSSRARRRIVILDCCYSGRALGRWMGDDEEGLSDRLEIDGTCLLTATARTRRALAPPDETFTAFTGQLISILSDGIPRGPRLLDMETIYRQLTVTLRSKSLPLPQRGQLDRGGDVALAHNRALVDALLPAPSETDDDVVPDHRAAQPAPAHPTVGASWRESLDPDREVVIDGLALRDENSRWLSFFAGVVLPLWTVLAAWHAWTSPHRGTLSALLVFGGACLYGARRVWVEHVVAVISVGLGMVAALLYFVAMFALTGRDTSWVEMLGLGLLLLLGLFLRFADTFMKEVNADISSERDAQDALIENVKQRSWLGDSRMDDPGAELLNPLMDLPSARFASISGGCFPFLVMCGQQVVLIAFVSWPPGVYTRRNGISHEILQGSALFRTGSDEFTQISGEADTWRAKLKRVNIQVVIVVRSTNAFIRSDVQLNLLMVNDIQFVQASRAADAVAELLVESAYKFNARALTEVVSYLDELARTPTPH